jgi:hypothetical protein
LAHRCPTASGSLGPTNEASSGTFFDRSLSGEWMLVAEADDLDKIGQVVGVETAFGVVAKDF